MGIIKKIKEWRNKRNEKWHIIDNMHDLPIGQYVRIMQIGKSEQSDIEKTTAILEVLTGWSAEDIENLSLPSYNALASGCSWLFKEPELVTIQHEYRVGDFVLRPTSATELTTAQFIDFQAYAKDADAHIIELLSTLLVPKGKKYASGYPMDAVRRWIAQTLPTDEALSLVAFFLINAEISLEGLATSLVEQVKTAPAVSKAQKEMKEKAISTLQPLLKNGDGLPTSNS